MFLEYMWYHQTLQIQEVVAKYQQTMVTCDVSRTETYTNRFSSKYRYLQIPHQYVRLNRNKRKFEQMTKMWLQPIVAVMNYSDAVPTKRESFEFIRWRKSKKNI